MSTHEHKSQNETETPQAQKPQRDPNGRYARGNDGGPGNPFGRQVGQLRKQVLAFVSKERMAKLVESMFERAIKGDMVAAKLILQYSIGKPTEAPNPDQLDLDEFHFFRREAGMLEHASRIRWEPDPSVVLALMRGTREAASIKLIRQTLAAAKAADERDKRAKESEVQSPESGAQEKNWKPPSKEEFTALREQVLLKGEERRKKEAAQHQGENHVGPQEPSSNGKLQPAGT